MAKRTIYVASETLTIQERRFSRTPIRVATVDPELSVISTVTVNTTLLGAASGLLQLVDASFDPAKVMVIVPAAAIGDALESEKQEEGRTVDDKT